MSTRESRIRKLFRPPPIYSVDVQWSTSSSIPTVSLGISRLPFLWRTLLLYTAPGNFVFRAQEIQLVGLRHNASPRVQRVAERSLWMMARNSPPGAFAWDIGTLRTSHVNNVRHPSSSIFARVSKHCCCGGIIQT